MSEKIQKRVGRMFCVTGYTPTSNPDSTPVTRTPKSVGQCDTESNSSGYLSSSSFESSSEEKRLGLNEQKVFQLWEKWSEQRDQPKSSTPKTADCTYRSRLNLSTDIHQSTLSIRKNLGAQTETEPECNEVAEKDSFWDIVTPQLFKSRSENDMRGENRIHSVDFKRDPCTRDRVQTLRRHDAGSSPNLSKTRSNPARSSDWKRKPYHTLSTSDQDLRLSRNSPVSCSNDSVNSAGSSGYQSLPRYRVVVNEPESKSVLKSSSSCELINKLSQTCADFTDSSVPVDESMTEFLSNVDQDNLASFLKFYDKVTNTAAYEKARRNPKNYEAVYY